MSFISFKDVRKSFSGNPVLDNVSFSLEKGGIYGFIGRNGSGKTVVFKLMSGLIVPDSGEILYNGENLSAKRRFIDRVGVMIETPGFIPYYSGYKNLKLLADLNKKIDEEQVKTSMKQVGLEPNLKRHVRKYSLGMRQRLGLAQAIMEDPDILILDEPMNGLDKDGVADIRKYLLNLKDRGKTIIIASHSAEDIEILCDTVSEMDKGILMQKN